MAEEEKIIPLNEEEPDTVSEGDYQIVPIEDDTDTRINRRLLAPNSAQPGRSVKLRDVFLLSGCVKADGALSTYSNFSLTTQLNYFDFNKNEFHVGMVIRITAMGYYSAANGSDTLTLEIGFGTSTSITAIMAIVSTATAVSDAPWNLEWVGIITSLGGIGTIAHNIRANMNRVVKDSRADEATLSTVSDRRLALTASWSTALAGNSVSINTFLVEVLN